MLRTIVLSVVILAGFLFTTGCSNSMKEQVNSDVPVEDISAGLADIPVTQVDSTQQDGLVYMREEEKLARDTYIAFYAKWDKRVFNNISHSEQMHMDALKTLLDRYEINDPVGDNDFGVFINSKLQKLYDDLQVSGGTSLVSALKAGAVIEEIDIQDLQNEIDKNAENEDIVYVYVNLMRGSRNHLRAFVRNLARQSVTYSPQYLSEELYRSIIDGEMEHCH